MRNISKRISPFLAFLCFLFTACSTEERLEKTLFLIEEKVQEETVFGRQTKQYLLSKKTKYILDDNLPSQSKYFISDDSIHYNPKFYPPLKAWKEQILLGRPIGTIVKLHEELHRAQENLSSWGILWKFIRENGEIIENVSPNGKVIWDFKIIKVVPNQLIEFATVLSGRKIQTLQEAGEILNRKMQQWKSTRPERMLLKEIHAYIASDFVSPEEVYNQLYEEQKIYKWLPKPSFDEFSHLCGLIDKLYAFYEFDHDKVAAFVGNSTSISQFKKNASALLSSIPPNQLKKGVEKLRAQKIEWLLHTKKIAKELL